MGSEGGPGRFKRAIARLTADEGDLDSAELRDEIGRAHV